ncbi:MAG: UDP-N-acetylmuramate:L-alanyl-gamma-D-glutamyl-meso-diaminopimelate ligase [Agarilytica sp.]
MHIHILGICGTFMGSLAQLAKELGYRVSGSDQNVYPPMSTQLESAGIEIMQGFEPGHLDAKPDLIVVGNVVSRGNPIMEAVLNRGLPYVSGPQWLAEHVLQGRWVLAVSGTHGKTTTSSMLAWILESANMQPGFLIGGVPQNFSVSARLGGSDFFVVEADEYDTAFFDKRSKFVHYRPRTLVINNLEFDHADIFPDLAAIQRQFHHLIRTVPQEGLIVHDDTAVIQEVLNMGLWSDDQCLPVDFPSECGDWSFALHEASGQHFDVLFQSQLVGSVQWPLTGLHNVRNAIAAIAAARHVGVVPELACEALTEFKNVKRRMELIGEVAGWRIYDDFAHHPTAIATTLEGLRNSVGDDKIIAVIEPRSNTMKQGCHKEELAKSIDVADAVMWFEDKSLPWSLDDYVASPASRVFASVDDIIQAVLAIFAEQSAAAQPCHLVIMSNGGFQNIHQRLVAAMHESVQ